MPSGTVKWFDDAKGYGFIEQENGEDVFVHYTAITGEGYRSLAEGAEVEFEIEDSPLAPQSRQRGGRRPPRLRGRHRW